ncbi:6708_t:CDS:2, partial [Racocetra persica]
VALIHVPTGKYLSTNRQKYNLGPSNQQYMAICNGQEIDLKNDVWIILGANNKKAVNIENPVSFNTVIGLKHQATEVCLHSHDMNYGKVTPKSHYQQVTICPGRNSDDNWEIRSFGSGAFCNYLRDDDTISFFHITTSKPALYSHNVLLDNGCQEVCCHGYGSDENNK